MLPCDPVEWGHKETAMQLIKNNLGSEFVHLVGWLEGKGFHTALKALRYARKLHDGTRKDGFTPEFAHQLFQVLYIKSFVNELLYPEETIAVILLHDTIEDTDKKAKEIYDLFGQRIGEGAELMTKKKDGVIIPYQLYFQRMSENAITTVAKPIDRVHNLKSMPGANWPIKKMRHYGDEGDEFFLPLLKVGRQNFPEQANVYYNLKTAIEMQLEWSRRYLTVMEENESLKADLAEADNELMIMRAIEGAGQDMDDRTAGVAAP